MNKIEDIKIEEVEVFFSAWTMNFFKKRGITTLGQLFTFVENEENLKTISVTKRKDLLRNVNIIRCKYFNEDPHFDLNSRNIRGKSYLDSTYDHTHQIINLGISSPTTASQIIIKQKDTFKDTLEYYSNPKNLQNLRNVGPKRKKEIITKATIILNYYKTKEIQPATDDIEDLKRLNAKLKKLIAKRDDLNNKINSIMNEINTRAVESIQKEYKRGNNIHE